MNAKEYIESGILETYLLGLASDEEVKRLLEAKRNYPEVKGALDELEADMERIAALMAIAPPPGTWEKIEEHIDESIIKTATDFLKLDRPGEKNGHVPPHQNGHQYIDGEAESPYMRVHKTWKTLFIAVFILGKIFLACAIYFYLENRQAQEQIRELKSELHHPVQQFP